MPRATWPKSSQIQAVTDRPRPSRSDNNLRLNRGIFRQSFLAIRLFASHKRPTDIDSAHTPRYTTTTMLPLAWQYRAYTSFRAYYRRSRLGALPISTSAYPTRNPNVSFRPKTPCAMPRFHYPPCRRDKCRNPLPFAPIRRYRFDPHVRRQTHKNRHSIGIRANPYSESSPNRR